MLRKVAFGVVAAALMSAPALAADAPRPVIVPPPVIVKPSNPFDGFYAGGHAGYGWGNRNGCVSFGFPPTCTGTTYDYNQSGWLAGGQVGVNKVLGAGGLVIGAEVSASLSGIQGNLNLPGFGGFLFNGPGEYSTLATATAKIGWTNNKWMIYAEGGLSLGSFKYQSAACSFDSQQQGWLGGVGAEVAMANNNSLFVEWNRYQFNDKDVQCTFNILGFPLPLGVDTRSHIDTIKVGFNHYFK